MNCYNHPESPAHGFCGVCKKALCKSCMAEEVNYVCCRGACQTRIHDVDKLFHTASRAASRHSLYAILGIFLFLTAVVLGEKNEPISSVLATIGVSLFIASRIIYYKNKRKNAEQDAAANP